MMCIYACCRYNYVHADCYYYKWQFYYASYVEHALMHYDMIIINRWDICGIAVMFEDSLCI